ncbi:MAG TPA: methylmalonyl Co-A mutase-associated GTPase MeaB [Acidobacteriota bacterium]
MTSLFEDIRAGKPRAVARAISLVENRDPHSTELMRQVFLARGEALVLGVTGAPGSGKSTLADQLIEHYRRESLPVGVVAVDPSSPFTGGAILGDRIRMMRHSLDPGVFIRSMATRGHLGGLAKATGEAIAVFEAAGKRMVLVETVGVGQDEVEVVKLADIVLVILTPGQGDDIQAFKAGIMEIADIFVLNKADSPGADKLEKQLKAMLELGHKDKRIPAVIRTVATEGRGTQELAAAVEDFRRHSNGGLRETRKKLLIHWLLLDTLQAKLLDLISGGLSTDEFDDYVEKIYRKESDPYTAADSILARLKS